MRSNAQKIPFIRTINEFATNRIQGAFEQFGKSLPASVVSVDGAIVTVKFEISDPLLPQITIPIETDAYFRAPTQIGDTGVVRASDTFIGNVTGLGSGTPSTIRPFNLSALVFCPVGNKNWSAPDDVNACLVVGPNGAIIRDTDSNCVITLDTAHIELKMGSNTITISAAGIDIEGALTINGTAYLVHTHSGVTTGGGTTGPVVP